MATEDWKPLNVFGLKQQLMTKKYGDSIDTVTLNNENIIKESL